MIANRYAVEWELASGRGQLNRHDRNGVGLSLEQAKAFLPRVLARAHHVTGSRFIGKVVLLKPAEFAKAER